MSIPGTSYYDTKHPSRPAKKHCAKCGLDGWFRARDRRCKRMEVVSGFRKPRYYCWGKLATLSIERPARAKKAASDLPTVANRKRSKAAKLQRLAEARVKSLGTRIKRLTTALQKQERRVAHYARLATRSDAEIAAARERIKTAQLVQTVTRRLLKAAGVAAPSQGE